MDEANNKMQELLTRHLQAPPPTRQQLLQQFLGEEKIIKLLHQIDTCEREIMENWKIRNRIEDIARQHIAIPNGTVGKPYTATLNTAKYGWHDITIQAVTGLEELSLAFDRESHTLSGTPTQSGDHKITIHYRLQGENEAGEHTKDLNLILNPDPKSLWKDLPSNKSAHFWKPDAVSFSDKLGDKHLVAASKRGRSHANVGGFRDDDLAYKQYGDTGWSAIAVADGAGSASFSRQGAALACETVISFFEQAITRDAFAAFNLLLEKQSATKTDEGQKKIAHFVYTNLGQAALTTHKKLEEFAAANQIALKDLHTTLIFALIKKVGTGYAILTFGVGDCPIALLSKDMSTVTLMNWLDVGEFGGGTRFLTMPDVFKSDKFATRFSFKLVDDFSYLILMTDGVYDPKFGVEANLQKIACWQAFLNDLNGQNDENAQVDLQLGNTDVDKQLLAWLDFWSPGNHDDRTIVIVY